MIRTVIWLVTALILCGSMAFAKEGVGPIQTSVGSKNAGVADTLSDQANDGRIIDSIVIDNRNIYDTKDPRYSGLLFKVANSLHYVSRQWVIKRELLFQVGEPYSTLEAEETARNLRSRYYLFDAWVQTERLPNGHLAVRIVTIDQWSIRGGLNINREGNRTRYKMGFEERNLLGLNQFVSFEYVIQEAEKNYAKLVYRDVRFMGLPYVVRTSFNADPRNEDLSLTVQKPFYDLEQRISYSVRVGTNGGRRDVYQDETKIGQWHSKADEFDISGTRRWGNRWDKLSIGVGYLYHNNEITDRAGSGFLFPNDSLYHQPSLSLSVYHSDFVRLRRVAAFTYLEDFTLTTGLFVTGARAYRAGLVGYHYNRIGLEASYARQMDSSLFFFDFQREYWFKHGVQLRRSTGIVAKYYNTGLNWVTFASRLMYNSDLSAMNNLEVFLGGTTGIRGFDEVARTGERSGVFNLESRFYPNIEFLSVIFGGVVFTDIGKVWKKGETTNFRDLEYSIGAGLRISLEKAAKSEIIRIDATVTRYGDWAVAFGTGQYF